MKNNFKLYSSVIWKYGEFNPCKECNVGIFSNLFKSISRVHLLNPLLARLEN